MKLRKVVEKLSDLLVAVLFVVVFVMVIIVIIVVDNNAAVRKLNPIGFTHDYMSISMLVCY